MFGCVVGKIFMEFFHVFGNKRWKNGPKGWSYRWDSCGMLSLRSTARNPTHGRPATQWAPHKCDSSHPVSEIRSSSLSSSSSSRSLLDPHQGQAARRLAPRALASGEEERHGGGEGPRASPRGRAVRRLAPRALVYLLFSFSFWIQERRALGPAALPSERRGGGAGGALRP